jgi:hypothetical protein
VVGVLVVCTIEDRKCGQEVGAGSMRVLPCEWSRRETSNYHP